VILTDNCTKRRPRIFRFCIFSRPVLM